VEVRSPEVFAGAEVLGGSGSPVADADALATGAAAEVGFAAAVVATGVGGVPVQPPVVSRMTIPSPR
jgi:hypothetical protein